MLDREGDSAAFSSSVCWHGIFWSSRNKFLELFFFDVIISSGHTNNNYYSDIDGWSFYPSMGPSLLNNSNNEGYGSSNQQYLENSVLEVLKNQLEEGSDLR